MSPVPERKPPVSIFELAPDVFASCRLLRRGIPLEPQAPIIGASLDDGGAGDDRIGAVGGADKGKEATLRTRLTCNTCKAEFESLQDQRAHFKSDIHRLNVKLSIAGKNIIKLEDADNLDGDRLLEDFEVSSISGSEDETEHDSLYQSGISKKENGKQKLHFSLQSGEIVSLWRCLVLNETEDISSMENNLSNTGNGGTYLDEGELLTRLKSLVSEPRNKSHFRIILLASGGHFAGCVFDGNTVIAHKTFHRYVVRARAGKVQSAKDGTGKTAHSAGSSLRRHNEAALKKEIQELLISWRPYVDASSDVFIYAPSRNNKILFDELNSQLSWSHIIKRVPMTVHRPTFKEAKRVYNYLTSVSYDLDKEDCQEERNSANACEDASILQCNDSDIKHHLDIEDPYLEPNLAVKGSATCENDSGSSHEHESTALHEAAKSGDTVLTLELLEQGMDPCIQDFRGRTPYMLASEKEVRNIFRRFMASNPDKWDWHAAKVPSALTKEMEEAQAAKQAEKDAKKKAKAKELKKLKKAKEKAKAKAAPSENASEAVGQKGREASSTASHKQQQSKEPIISKEEEQRRALEAEREKRAAAAEKRLAVLNARLGNTTIAPPSSSEGKSQGSDLLSCSCCGASLAGKVPFHRYNYKYCTSTCMHVHKEMLEDG